MLPRLVWFLTYPTRVTTFYQNEEAFSDYCGRAAALASMLPGPLDALSSDLDFVGMQVILRHGARTTACDLSCVHPIRSPSNLSSCHLKPMGGVDWSEGSAAIPKQYHNTYGTEPALESTCVKGQLLDEAVDQFRALADKLTQSYLSKLPQKEELRSKVQLFSVDVERMMASLILLQHFLFGASSAGLVVETQPADIDPWHMSATCPRGQQAKARKSAVAMENARRHPDFLAKWRSLAGAEFTHDTWDCLEVALCTNQSFLQLPPQLQPDSDLFHEALKISAAMVQASYLQDVFEYTLLAAPALLEMRDYAEKQALGKVPPLSLRVVGDTMIVPLLLGLQAWDGAWPHYAEALVLEVYRSKEPVRKTKVRLLRRGEAVLACQEDGHRGLCAIEDLLPQNIVQLQDPVRYAHQCELDAKEPVVLKAGEPVMQVLSSGGVALLIALAFLAGHCHGRRSSDLVLAIRIPLLSSTCSADMR
ncbi:Acp6 [Symbiodinium natans]|uniref:Acp6 protein n=1 Tax=Symbiodinium natans TaxID=878477 RepID=A0A812LGF9_9DINO|nr:Acp6 [Symbiodinium natans]